MCWLHLRNSKRLIIGKNVVTLSIWLVYAIKFKRKYSFREFCLVEMRFVIVCIVINCTIVFTIYVIYVLIAAFQSLNFKHDKTLFWHRRFNWKASYILILYPTPDMFKFTNQKFAKYIQEEHLHLVILESFSNTWNLW